MIFGPCAVVINGEKQHKKQKEILNKKKYQKSEVGSISNNKRGCVSVCQHCLTPGNLDTYNLEY